MIRSWNVLVVAAAVGFLAGTGCNQSARVPSTPDGTITAVSQQLAEGNPGIVWEALPANYQTQLQDEVIRAFAAKMDPDIYGKGSSVVKKLVAVLRDKRDFVLPALMANPMVQMAKVDKAEIEQHWSQVVGLLDTIANSELGDLEKLKSIDVGQFLNSTGSEIMRQISQISALSEDDPYNKEFKAKVSQLQTELVQSSADTAKVKITVPGQSPDTLDLVKVQGKWLPKEMVAQWDDMIQKAKTQIAGMSPETMAKNKPMVMGVLTALDTALDQLAQAKTAEEFNKTLQGVMSSLPLPGMGGGKPGPSQ